MMEEVQDRYGDMLYLLGWGSLSRRSDDSWIDGPKMKWKSNVKIVIKYSIIKNGNGEAGFVAQEHETYISELKPRWKVSMREMSFHYEAHQSH